MNRRTFLQSSAAVGSAALLPRIARPARAASVRIDVPTVDQVVVREVTDGDHNIFLRPSETPGLTVQRTGMTDAAQGRTASVSPIYFWYLKRPSNVGTITSTEAPLRLRLTTVVISSKRCRSSPRPSNSSLRLPISSRQDGGSSPGCKEGQARLIRLGPTVLITDIICKR